MAVQGSPVVLINRTPRILKFVADGQHYELVPGENYGFNEGHVPFAKNQNPKMGSEDYHMLTFETLVAVKGTKDDASPIAEEELQAIERFDRLSMPGADKIVLVPIRHKALRGNVASLAGASAYAVGDQG